MGEHDVYPDPPAPSWWWREALLLPLTAFAAGCVLGPPQSVEFQSRGLACLLGLTLGLLYWHRYRGLGLATIALFAAWIATLFPPAEFWLASSLLIGVAYTRLGLAFSWAIAATARYLWADRIWVLSGAGLLLGLVAVGPVSELPPVVLGLLVVIALRLNFRPTFEFTCEPILWMKYRIRRSGTGNLPPHGACIVIANHACWLDPLFLAKALPRPITPMMTARFHDLPYLRVLLRRVFRVIRVPERHILKQETPDEVREAIEALDRGECLVLFPEGYLRRDEDRVIRRFGRGVWQILHARPGTPIYCCWIEGGWGSYFSYCGGPPRKNKRPDLRRRIEVVIPEPIMLDARTLSKHLVTRISLMNHTLESRSKLGLPAIPPFEVPKDEDA